MISAQTVVYEMKEPIALDDVGVKRHTVRVQCPYCHYVSLAPYVYQARRQFLFPRFCGICGRQYADMENQVSMFD